MKSSKPIKDISGPDDVIVIIHEKARPIRNATDSLAEIAAVPLEGVSDSFSGREHDSILETQ
jgi:hypothetical protein